MGTVKAAAQTAAAIILISGCGPAVGAIGGRCLVGGDCDVGLRCNVDTCVANDPNVSCCDCLARNTEQDVVGDGVPADQNPPCVEDAGECAVELDHGGSISVSDFCTDERCPSECDFLTPT